MEDEFNSKRWGSAIFQWMQTGKERDRAPLAVLLRDFARPIPDFAREFLADLASDTLPRRDGRPVEYSGRVARSIASAVFAERERLESIGPNSDPKQAACEVIATRLDMKPDAIRRLVERLSPSITYEVWKSIGRPNWSLTP